MLSRVIYWMICSLLVWLCSACCRSETYYVDQEVKDFTVFQPGSWWVYVDSVSGRRDSVVLSRLSSEFNSVMTRKEGCYDKLEYFVYSVDVYNWVNGNEYVRINPNDEMHNDNAYDIHDLLRFCKGAVDIKWNNTDHIYTPIGVYDRNQKQFIYYNYGDTLIRGNRYIRISTNQFNPVLGYEGTVIVKRIGLVHHNGNNHNIFLVGNHTIQ